METEPGTVNNELRRDYIPTNNTRSFPALHLHSFRIRELVAKENVSVCRGQSGLAPGGSSPLAETWRMIRTFQVEKEGRHTRQGRVCWDQGEVSRPLGHKI